MTPRAASRRRSVGAALLLAAACAPAPLPLPPEPASEPAPRAEEPPLPAPCRRITHIDVSKQARRLRAGCEAGQVVELAVALGRGPDGPKRGIGDLRTPEGQYRISGPPQPSRRFHRFIPIDYPSLQDAENARAEGRLSETEFRRIADAHAAGTPPPGDTALGGGIGFHGEGARWRGDSLHLDWTYGCVALSDADLDFLAERTAIGTPVVIRP